MSLKIEKKQPVADVTVGKKGESEKVAQIPVGDAVLIDKPMANVGMKVGKTFNLGNYESLRVDISLYLPCEPDDQSVSDTFDLVNTWVDKKMGEIVEEYEDAL